MDRLDDGGGVGMERLERSAAKKVPTARPKQQPLLIRNRDDTTPPLTHCHTLVPLGFQPNAPRSTRSCGMARMLVNPTYGIHTSSQQPPASTLPFEAQGVSHL